MRVFVGGEKSGRVRDAFRALGHDAWSCDLEPSEVPGPHIQDDMMSHLGDGWDLAIFHPVCTYLSSSSGLHWNKRRPERQIKTDEAIQFVRRLWDCWISKIAIENPIGCLSTQFRKPDQIIQPWMFGHPEAKATCLWLRGLPLLEPTNVLQPRGGNPRRGWDNQTPSGQNKLGPSPERAANRARTYEGIAAAMAEQWGGKVSRELR